MGPEPIGLGSCGAHCRQNDQVVNEAVAIDIELGGIIAGMGRIESGDGIRYQPVVGIARPAGIVLRRVGKRDVFNMNPIGSCLRKYAHKIVFAFGDSLQIAAKTYCHVVV